MRKRIRGYFYKLKEEQRRIGEFLRTAPEMRKRVRRHRIRCRQLLMAKVNHHCGDVSATYVAGCAIRLKAAEERAEAAGVPASVLVDQYELYAR